jgi:hypothetical protein
MANNYYSLREPVNCFRGPSPILTISQARMITSVSSTISVIQQRRRTISSSSSSSLSRVCHPLIFHTAIFDRSFLSQGWKRVLLADGPRQTINALVLYYIIKSKSKVEGQWWNIMRYFPDGQKLSVSALTVTMLFTVLVFLGSLLLLIAAACIYIPLLCYIQGNLKVRHPNSSFLVSIMSTWSTPAGIRLSQS